MKKDDNRMIVIPVKKNDCHSCENRNLLFCSGKNNRQENKKERILATDNTDNTDKNVFEVNRCTPNKS